MTNGFVILLSWRFKQQQQRYAIVSCAQSGQEKRSATRKKTLAPQWDEVWMVRRSSCRAAVRGSTAPPSMGLLRGVRRRSSADAHRRLFFARRRGGSVAAQFVAASHTTHDPSPPNSSRVAHDALPRLFVVAREVSAHCSLGKERKRGGGTARGGEGTRHWPCILARHATQRHSCHVSLSLSRQVTRSG